ncbi:MAG: HDIG domain-containing protein [Methanoregulaceae archaeon]|nr:HDIG domain-containing protein [Methanoregulaceae archaeon]
MRDYRSLLIKAGCDPKVIAHCDAVCRVAMQYADSSGIADRELVRAGAMLHDIGRGTTHTVAHAQVGADLCRSMGFPEEQARIVECHTGAGITADECTLLGLLPRDCMPRTLEEKIVTNADNLIQGNRRITIDETLASAFFLPRKIRHRIYRLWLEMEQFR